jgi:transposase
MAQRKVSMRKVRSIIELHEKGKLSIRQIGKATGVSRPAVAKYLGAFKESGLSLDEAMALPDSALEDRLAGPQRAVDARLGGALAFFPTMAKELSKVGVTRDVLWNEYLKEYPDGFGYSQFCHHFTIWLKVDPEVSSQIEHLPGDRMYVDFTGKKLSWHDQVKALAVEVEVFVAILGASGYTYAEAVASQKRDDFILCNRNALEFFGGVPASIMPDCLKSAVSKGDKYESDINPEYEMFARHYQTVIMPARPHKPRDKALVEGAVNILYTRVFAPLRNRQICSLADLNAEILKLLAVHNGMRFQKLPQSRAERFELLDRPALKALPACRYEITRHRFATVQPNYHVEIREDCHYYSVPHAFAGRKVSVFSTARTVEVFHDNVRIAFHLRVASGGSLRYTTVKEHMPSHHRFYAEWTPERIRSWAASVGLNVKAIVGDIMAGAEHPEQGFKSSIGIIGLTKKYSADRVYMACRIARSDGASGYRGVKRVLETERDLVALASERLQVPLQFHENLRGQDDYQ